MEYVSTGSQTPTQTRVSVMVLEDNEFREEGAYGPDDVLTSPALPGLALEVRDIFADS